MTRLVYAPEALSDVQDILEFLGQQDEKLCVKFELDYRRAIERIRTLPLAWPKVGRSVRVKIVSKRFLYGIYFTVSRGIIYIGAVIQLKRSSVHWKRRFS
jgi:plasmid stabilization system protein ParE